MDYEKYLYKNSANITEEERNAFMERFKVVCRMKGLSVARLQIMLGKANAYFRNMGFISPKIAPEVLKIMPDLNIEYCNTGKGEMFIKDGGQQREGVVSEIKTVPLLPVQAMGGGLSEFSEGVLANKCEHIASPVKDADLAITVYGESMSPEYPSGCMVFVKKIDEERFIEWGCTYVLDTINGVVIKNVFPCEKENGEKKIICRSINPNFPDFEVRTEDISGMYKVLMMVVPK